MRIETTITVNKKKIEQDVQEDRMWLGNVKGGVAAIIIAKIVQTILTTTSYVCCKMSAACMVNIGLYTLC